MNICEHSSRLIDGVCAVCALHEARAALADCVEAHRSVADYALEAVQRLGAEADRARDRLARLQESEVEIDAQAMGRAEARAECFDQASDIVRDLDGWTGGECKALEEEARRKQLLLLGDRDRLEVALAAERERAERAEQALARAVVGLKRAAACMERTLSTSYDDDIRSDVGPQLEVLKDEIWIVTLAPPAAGPGEEERALPPHLEAAARMQQADARAMADWICSLDGVTYPPLVMQAAHRWRTPGPGPAEEERS